MAELRKFPKLTSNFMGQEYTVYFDNPLTGDEEFKEHLEALIEAKLWFDVEFVTTNDSGYIKQKKSDS